MMNYLNDAEAALNALAKECKNNPDLFLTTDFLNILPENEYRNTELIRELLLVKARYEDYQHIMINDFLSYAQYYIYTSQLADWDVQFPLYTYLCRVFRPHSTGGQYILSNNIELDVFHSLSIDALQYESEEEAIRDDYSEAEQDTHSRNNPFSKEFIRLCNYLNMPPQHVIVYLDIASKRINNATVEYININYKDYFPAPFTLKTLNRFKKKTVQRILHRKTAPLCKKQYEELKEHFLKRHMIIN